MKEFYTLQIEEKPICAGKTHSTADLKIHDLSFLRVTAAKILYQPQVVECT